MSHPAPAAWLTLASPSAVAQEPRPVRPRRVFLQVLLSVVLVVAVVALVGSWASGRIAEREAVNDAAQQAAVYADAVVEPALTDGIVDGDAAAVARLDRAVRERLLGPTVVRVKFWTADGTIVYSDEARLVGRTFELGEDEREVLRRPATRAEATDLDEPENVYERGQGRLLEVYRPVTTPGGDRLLFEMYAPYDSVVARSGDLWRGFAGITVSSLLALVVLLLPVLWRLLDRLRAAQEQRETSLRRSLDASDRERRRIAGTLHDGVVQELAATSFVVAGAAGRARAGGDAALARQLDDAAGAVRTGIGGLRSLLVDIYPPSLADTGITTALRDLVESTRSREADVRLRVPDVEPALDRDVERLLYQVAQETTRNAVRHARASVVDVSLDVGTTSVVLEVADDGDGFDPAAVLAAPEQGHFGLRLLADAAQEAGASLSVLSVPGEGTRWHLEVAR